jgi:hypothetical protein
MLNRHPVPLEPKFPEKLLQADRLRKRVKSTRLTVENHSE